MNDRQKELLRTLLVQNGQTLNIVDLTGQLGCSEKTVRNDLSIIEDLLAEYPDTYLKRQPGIGITLETEESEMSEIFQKLLSTEPKTQEDRFIEMAYHLLVSNKAITLQELSKKYFVPKVTIKKELDTIADWLTNYQLELISKPRLGNIVQGSELQKRSALAHLSELLSSLSDNKNYVLELFLPYEIATVKKALNELQRKYSIAFTDAAMENLLVHALIMMKRTRQKSPVTVPDKEKQAVYSYKEYKYALSFFEQLEAVFAIKFPEDERIYFTWHLISGKRKMTL
ncbi:PRD domain-containing protein [Metabacillus litoralis]|uniref:BglG family transcription antiterminator n=1 Tax=Metabacillus litoralis TaxID=152268 RepID=UPI001E4DD30E|nr:PRD domain-containing protein [Metabacillus litoralis]UHA60050.1 PRD domain-containing protein [Metabacillus litoralis]